MEHAKLHEIRWGRSVLLAPQSLQSIRLVHGILRSSRGPPSLAANTTKRWAEPVFHELLHPRTFATFQQSPQVNFKLARWLQDWESFFWMWQCEAAGKFGL